MVTPFCQATSAELTECGAQICFQNGSRAARASLCVLLQRTSPRSKIIAHRSVNSGRDARARLQADQQVGPTTFLRSLERVGRASSRAVILHFLDRLATTLAHRCSREAYLQLWTRFGSLNRDRSAELLLGAKPLHRNGPSRSSVLRFNVESSRHRFLMVPRFRPTAST
jgi:hypothetical protein